MLTRTPHPHLLLGTALAAFLLAGCHEDHVQSMVHPAGPAAQSIAWLWWILLAVLGGVFVITMLLTAIAMAPRRRADRPTEPPGQWFVVVGGIVLPCVILVGLLLVSLVTQLALRRPAEALTIRVTGHQWWWRVEYPEQGITLANELYIPAGRPVLLELRSADVIHSFWTPNLHGKMDLLTERTNLFWIQADRPGHWRGQCAEFCGLQHAWMAFEVVALEEAEFLQWIADRQETRVRQAQTPQEPALRRGQEVFVSAGCNTCHSIAGSPTTDLIAPDLTHIGTRRTIGAGLLPNNRGNLQGWLANPQALKPGSFMPRTYIAPEDLHALVEYLRSLE